MRTAAVSDAKWLIKCLTRVNVYKKYAFFT